MSNILEDTKFIMKKYHIKANKSLGQNFLIDDKVVEQIITKSCVNEHDLVIEIGPGLGTLTKFLLEKAKKVICIELDKKMIKILEDRFTLYNNFELLHNDILKVDLNSIIKKEKENSDITGVKIVANLPYYITTPIIMKLLEKEVADRLIATPGSKDTGAITYSVYYYATSEAILEVPKDSFIPEPEVTSKVIRLQIRKVPPVEVKSKKVMFKIIKSAFMQRRKTLLNALSNTKVFLNKEEGLAILKKLNLPDDIRAEKLTLQDFANITNEFIK